MLSQNAFKGKPLLLFVIDAPDNDSILPDVHLGLGTRQKVGGDIERRMGSLPEVHVGELGLGTLVSRVFVVL